MATLAEIKAHLAAKEAELKQKEEARKARSNNGGGGGDKTQYPFWDMKVGESATVRYLPDGNPDNLLPWVERQTIELEFDGTIGGERDTTERVKVKVPCPTMFSLIDPDYKVACKITAHIRPWWKVKGSDDYKLAQKYYRKQSWLTQGFVVSSPFEEEGLPENPIRRLTLTKKIFDKVFKAYNGTEFEEAPHDFDAGTDFVIEKTLQGEFNNYDTSYFQRRTRSLSAEERAAIETYGLFKLNEFVGKAPTEEQADIQYQMFLDSLDGKPYDFTKFGEHYRPWGVRGPNSGNSNDEQRDSGATGSESAGGSETASSSASTSEQADTSANTDDLIARIRRNALKA